MHLSKTKARIVTTLLVALGGASGLLSQSRNPQVTPQQYEQWKKDLSNWGRWGAADEIGTLNLITADKRRAALALAREGVAVSLAADADTVRGVDNPSPYERTMVDPERDRIAVMPHGMAHTHLDSLAHISDNGTLYNGYRPNRESLMAAGPEKNSIHNVKQGIVTRGVLLDIARLKGVPYLEPGTRIYASDLEAWEARSGAKVGAGDALFLRTGVWARRKAEGPWLRGRAEGGRAAGLDPSVIPWLRRRDIAVLASDSSSYVSPSEIPGAVHDFSLVYLGVHVLDNCDLEALSSAAAARNRWEFLVTISPLAIPNGTGSPVNPIAIF